MLMYLKFDLGTCHKVSMTGGRRTSGFIQKNFHSPYKTGQKGSMAHCEKAKFFHGPYQNFMVCFSAC